MANHDTSRFWAWFDATRNAAIQTDDGRKFHAAGFDLTHTGGGCTAWERAIPGTDWLIWIATSEAGHELTPADIEAGDDFGAWIVHKEESHHSRAQNANTVEGVLKIADEMAATVQRGEIDSLHMEYVHY
jgi:hypothetical protein